MKNTELRIGNWVNAFGIEQEILIGVFYSKGADVWFVDHLEIKDIEPIPLTPEWLEGFGFKPLVNDWQIKGMIIHTRKRGYVVNTRTQVIKYVHQLQNLYYALTNTELEIND